MSGGFHTYHHHAPAHYHESGLAFGAPHLPFRLPELASSAARYNHPPAGHFHYNQTASMSDAFLSAEDEYAHLQKLSSEYEPEVTVRSPPSAPAPPQLTRC